MPHDGFSQQAGSLPELMFAEMMNCWRAQNLDAMFTYIHTDAVHEINVDSKEMPQLGSMNGATAMRARFQYMIDTFELRAFHIATLRADGDVAQGTITFTYRHRASGEEVSSFIRLLATWRDGQFVHFKEFNDEAFLTAFMRLTNEI